MKKKILNIIINPNKDLDNINPKYHNLFKKYYSNLIKELNHKNSINIGFYKDKKTIERTKIESNIHIIFKLDEKNQINLNNWKIIEKIIKKQQIKEYKIHGIFTTPEEQFSIPFQISNYLITNKNKIIENKNFLNLLENYITIEDKQLPIKFGSYLQKFEKNKIKNNYYYNKLEYYLSKY